MPTKQDKKKSSQTQLVVGISVGAIMTILIVFFIGLQRYKSHINSGKLYP